jgi:hypothetical protein
MALSTPTAKACGGVRAAAASTLSGIFIAMMTLNSMRRRVCQQIHRVTVL